MGRPIFADTDRVVREHEQHFGPRQCGEPNGGAHVVDEHEECAAGGQHTAVQRHAHHRRAHRVLSNAVVHLPTTGGAR